MHRHRGELAYRFDADHDDPPDELVELLGGKGAGLVAMTAMGLPVPPGFTLTTEACRIHMESGWTDELDATVRREVHALERNTGRRLGEGPAPLLVSVRSGAASSMPGMMDTVLNVGMTDDVAAALAEMSHDPSFSADTHRRALLSFAEVVAGSAHAIPAVPAAASVERARSLLAAADVAVPDDPMDQIVASVRAVFDSWSSDRARRYRTVEGIDHGLGTAATVQVMVFGNLGTDSGTGVAFTRDPSSGEHGLMGDFLIGAQGEDVVAGRHRTLPIAEMNARWPGVFDELHRVAEQLERHYADMVDIEFTVERGRLWILQARRAKRSPVAAFRVAVDMADDPTFPVDRAEAVRRCRHLLDAPPMVADESDVLADGGDSLGSEVKVVAGGLAAAPGVATGVLCTDVDEAVALEARGVDVVLVRRDTSPSDVAGMVAAVGLVTSMGGLVSHAAVVARSWGLPAVVGVADLEFVDGGVVGPGGRMEEGTVVTVDGDRGRLLLGSHSPQRSEAPHVAVIRSWAGALDDHRSSVPVRSTDRAGSRVGEIWTGCRFAALHAIRIKGMARLETLVAMTGFEADVLRSQLDALMETGDVDFVSKRELFRITKDGKVSHAAALSEAVDGLDLRDLAYDDFLHLNGSMKSLCTDWQIRDGRPNDHADRDYDALMVDRLCQLDDRAQVVIGSFPSVVPWTARYPARLAAARARVVAGDPKALTGVMCDSYHDIWMELHEDLILTQGIDRTAEGSH